MIRLNIVTEGPTEEGFIREVLGPHLANVNVYAYSRSVETSRDRRRNRIYRGGMVDYAKLKKDVLRWMKQDQNPEARFTTMVDLYRIPNSFPGYASAMALGDAYQIVENLEQAFGADIGRPRLIPYIQLHEFEALLFCGPEKLDHMFPGRDRAISALVRIAEAVESPELIDSGDQTAPSKRIIAEIPEYGDQKASAGPIVAGKIGLDAMREACPHFAAWVQRLEALGT